MKEELELRLELNVSKDGDLHVYYEDKKGHVDYLRKDNDVEELTLKVIKIIEDMIEE